MTSYPNDPQILAAGGIVVDPIPRTGESGAVPRPSDRVVVVHRPKHADWSLPKGKSDAGETLQQTALREVLEETGLRCRIIREIAENNYQYRANHGEIKSKRVHYFLMEPVGGTMIADGGEVDRVEWMEISQAMQILTYDGDKRVLAGFAERASTGGPTGAGTGAPTGE